MTEHLDNTSETVVMPHRVWQVRSELTRVEQVVQWFVRQIEERVLRVGQGLPSIRAFAQQQGLSRFTVVEAYDRLVAQGYVQAKAGSGYYVRLRDPASLAKATHGPHHWAQTQRSTIDVVWLLRNMFRKLPTDAMPGGGVMPPDWLDEGLIGSSLRALSRQNTGALVDYGTPQGYFPLRQQMATRLTELGIVVAPEHLLTTAGVTQGLDLVAQQLLAPGDTVLVDDPSWFVMFGRFAQLGANIVGVPRGPDGPDLAALRQAAQQHRPKLFVVVSVLHNPTSTSMSAANAFQVLRIAEEFDFVIAEDDVYGDLHPGGPQGPAIRLAALDQLQRVVYLTGFSKTLAASLRVGLLAGPPELVAALTERKMLVGLTTSELGERVVYRVLAEGHYRRHLDRLRGRLDAVREPTVRALEALGLRAFASPGTGMFVWMDSQRNANQLAQTLLADGFVLAPGSLFHPDQRPSTWLRFNIATSSNPKMLTALSKALDDQALEK